MKILKFIIIILSITAFSSYAQNLVPNYSFEVYDTCPFSSGQIYSAIPWVDATNASSDYYNACSVGLGVPNNSVGSQNALDGNAYAGFAAYYSPLTDFREYIQVKLSDTLLTDSCYKLIYYVSIAEQGMYGVNRLSAYFSSTAVSCSSCFLAFPPQVNYYSSTVLGDSYSWFKVEGVFKAQGNEEFMTIGNFNTDANTSPTLVHPTMTNPMAYYFIDSVSLVKVTCPLNIGIQEHQKIKPFTISPNPNNGNMLLQYSLNPTDKAEINIYDISGKLINSYLLNSSANKISINEEQLENGVYFYQIIVNNTIVQSDKLIIIK